MSKSMLSVLSVAAFALSTSLALADDMSGNQPTAQPVSNVVSTGAVVCHHDGEIIQGPNGAVMCHMRPVGGVHYKSREWFSGIGARAASMNGN